MKVRSTYRRLKYNQGVRNFNSAVKEIRAFELSASTQLPGDSLKSRAIELREHSLDRSLTRKEDLEFIGLIAEAVFRSHGFRLHDVQIQATLAGRSGAIAEMQTGEGKTIVIGTIAATMLLDVPSVHVATTNAYLAERDRNIVVPVFEQIGISCGLLPKLNNFEASKSAYTKDITYGPGYQFGFDYLRDQIYLRSNRQSLLGQRIKNSIRGIRIEEHLMQPSAHHCMLVDEADSVMIDEAITPLVISGSAREKEDRTPYDLAMQLASKLELGKDFSIKSPLQKIEIKEATLEKCHQSLTNFEFALARPWRIYISNALRADKVLKLNEDYVVQNGEVQIVDQYTGRIFSDRTWQNGLHQAVEAKEGLEIRTSPPSVARITRQRYFQLYDRLAGLTGTATQVKSEFKNIYRIEVSPIPTNRPCIREILTTRFFRDESSKIRAIGEDLLERHATGQPILVGTRTIFESVSLKDHLQSIGIEPVVLNGLQDETEAEIVAAAGMSGCLTIATNMAGRGTDIKVAPECLALGGLHVVGFSPNESARIDRQLAGRTARQGQPGSVQFFVSAHDEIFELYGQALGKRIARSCNSNGETNQSFQSELLQLQSVIEKIQYESRLTMIRQDNWMDQVRETIDEVKR